MPASGIFTTKEVQQKLIHGIQDVIIKSGNRISDGKSLFFMALALVDLLFVAYRLWKLGKPTHDNVNQYNSHTMIDLRDWFLAHDKSQRNHKFYEAFFNLVIMKYEFDAHMGKRLEKWLEKWYELAKAGKWIFGKHPLDRWLKKWYEAAQAGKWLFSGKHPATEWELDEDDKEEPAVIRQKKLVDALNKGEHSKVLGLIE